MRGFASVFGREVRRLRMVLLATVVFALIEWPVAHFVKGWTYGEALTILALVTATSLGAAYALIIGATVLARDTSEGTIAFDYALPLSPASIGFGRLAAGFSVTLAAAFVPLVPALVSGDLGLFGSIRDFRRLDDPEAVLSLTALGVLFLGGLLLLYLLSHALSTMIRSHSAWLAADLAVALSLVGIGGTFLSDLLFHFMLPPLMAGTFLLIAAWLGGLIGGAWAQSAMGRTDSVRGHRALSIVLWGSVALGTAILVGLHAWALHPSYADVVGERYLEMSPAGRWYSVNTPVKGRGKEAGALFLGRTGGDEPRLVGWGMQGNYVRFSPDERWAVLVTLNMRPIPGFAARILPLEPPGPARETDLRFGNSWPDLFFSADSKSLLVLADDEARLLSFPDLDQTGAVKLPPGGGKAFSGGRFLPDGTLLLSSWSPQTGPEGDSRLLLWRWDPRAKRFERQAVLQGALHTIYWLSPSGDRILYQAAAPAGKALRLADCATGRLLAEPATGADSIRAVFLQDGRFLVSERREKNRRSLRLFDAEGGPLGSLEVSAERWVIPGGEVAPGKVAVFENDRGRPFSSAEAFVYDADANSLTLLPGLHPGWRFFFAIEERLAPPPPERAAWRRLFIDGKGRFVLHDFTTGRDEPLAAEGR